MYTLSVSADRRYQLQSEQGNRAVDALLEQLRVPESSWRLYAEMLDGPAPKMISVLLAQDVATGTHEFTDSVNNGR